MLSPQEPIVPEPSLFASIIGPEDAMSVARPMIRFLSEAVANPPQDGYSCEALKGFSYILDLLEDILAHRLRA